MRTLLLILLIIPFIYSQTCTNGLILFNGQCRRCEVPIPGCAVCTNSTYCTRCNTTYKYIRDPFPVSQGISQCRCPNASITPQDMFMGLFCETCRELVAGCLECIDAVKCRVCNEANGFYNNGTVCKCINAHTQYQTLKRYATYDNCEPCSQVMKGCITCMNQNYCLTCDTNFVFNATRLTSYCACLSPFVLVGNKCVQNCGIGCLSCSNQACNSCDQNNNFVLDQNSQCKCQSKYYLNGTQCLACSEITVGCILCQNSTDCETCDSNKGFSEIAQNGKCICKDRHIKQQDSCIPCFDAFQNCIDCSQELKCTQCSSGYGVSPTGSCHSCNMMIGCISCSKSDICEECDTANHFQLNSSTGQCQCASRYVFDQNLNQCLLCSSYLSNCSTCSSPQYCTSCSSDQFTLQQLTNTSQICQKCSDTIVGCSRCSSSSICTQCSTYFRLAEGKCYCQNGSYLSVQSCVLCSSWSNHCLVCNSNGCTSCASNYVVSGTGCNLSCNIIGCSTCKNNTSCLVCETNFQLKNNKCFCKQGFTLVNQSCQSCNTSLVGCQNCQSTSCCKSCVDTYYLDIFSSSCKKCGFGCKRCNLLICLTCISPAYINTILCDCLCVSSAYKNTSTNTCQYCNSTNPFCSQCLNSTYCTSCTSGYSAINGKCGCYSGQYYHTSFKICKSCPSNCEQCSNATTCTKCDNSKNRILINGYCACKPGYKSLFSILGYNDNTKCF